MTKKKKGSRLKEQLPSNRSSYDKQLNSLRGYAIASNDGAREVTNKTVAGIVEIHEGTLAYTSPFFVSVGLVHKTNGQYLPADEVIDFNLAYSHGDENAGHKLAPILKRSWFGLTLIPKLRFKSLSMQEAITTLGVRAGADDTYKGRLKTLLLYLEEAGLIEINGDKISLTSEKLPVSNKKPGIEDEIEPVKHTGSNTTDFPPRNSKDGVSLSFSINVESSQFASWSPDRIAAFFSGLSQVLQAKATLEENQTDM
ncbi:MAG: hypothetical protein FVQ83_11260 [Chloroflexi bacterium]|nr:hypothetical protein [Chloroflexota bacterium]